MTSWEIFAVIMSSSVIAAIISGIVAIVITRKQYKNSIKVGLHAEKTKLMTSIFNELQDELKRAEDQCIEAEMNATKDKDEYMTGITLKVAMSKLHLALQTINQIEVLISADEAKGLKESAHSLIIFHQDLVRTAECVQRGELINSDNFKQQCQKFVDDADKLLDKVRVVLVSELNH